MQGLRDLDELDALFSALSHRTRRAVLVTLHAHGGSLTSGAIAGRMDHSWQTTSRHLRLLEEAGLVELQMRGRERLYRLRTERMRAELQSWSARFDAPAGVSPPDGPEVTPTTGSGGP